MSTIAVLTTLSLFMVGTVKAEKPKASRTKTLCGIPSTSGYSLRSNLDLLKKLKVKEIMDESGKLSMNFIVPAKLNDVSVSRYHLVFKDPSPIIFPIRTDWWVCMEGIILSPAVAGDSEKYGVLQMTDAMKYNQSNGEAGME